MEERIAKLDEVIIAAPDPWKNWKSMRVTIVGAMARESVATPIAENIKGGKKLDGSDNPECGGRRCGRARHVLPCCSSPEYCL
jgi:hypothetical protein